MLWTIYRWLSHNYSCSITWYIDCKRDKNVYGSHTADLSWSLVYWKCTKMLRVGELILNTVILMLNWTSAYVTSVEQSIKGTKPTSTLHIADYMIYRNFICERLVVKRQGSTSNIQMKSEICISTFIWKMDLVSVLSAKEKKAKHMYTVYLVRRACGFIVLTRMTVCSYVAVWGNLPIVSSSHSNAWSFASFSYLEKSFGERQNKLFVSIWCSLNINVIKSWRKLYMHIYPNHIHVLPVSVEEV